MSARYSKEVLLAKFVSIVTGQVDIFRLMKILCSHSHLEHCLSEVLTFSSSLSSVLVKFLTQEI